MVWPIIWNYEVPPSGPRLVVGQSDFDLLIESLKEVEGGKEELIEVLVVSGYLEESKELVSFLAADENDELPGPVGPLTALVGSICVALKDFSYPASSLFAQWDLLKSDRAQRLGALERSIDLLLTYYKEMEGIFLAGAAVTVDVSGSKRPAWWKSKPTLISEIERWQKCLAKEVEYGRSVDVVLAKVNSMLSSLRPLEKTRAVRTSEVFVVASAFSFCCAVIQSKRFCPSNALMMLNRSTEFVLTAFALEQGLATVTADEVQLHTGDLLSVGNLLKVLVNSGRVNGATFRGHPFSRVNTSRNQLSYTHGLARVYQAEVEQAIEETRIEIRGLDPSLGWWAKVKAIRPEFANATNVVASALDYEQLVEGFDTAKLRLHLK